MGESSIPGKTSIGLKIAESFDIAKIQIVSLKIIDKYDKIWYNKYK